MMDANFIVHDMIPLNFHKKQTQNSKQKANFLSEQPTMKIYWYHGQYIYACVSRFHMLVPTMIMKPYSH